MSELKPCPFCGGEASVIRHADFYGIWHGKSDSPCYFSEKEFWGFLSEAEAIEAWNRRANDED